MNSRNAEHGLLTVEGESITFRQGGHHWTVPLESIVAVGEATNQWGPFADDWFVCLITRPEGRWYEAPVYASGVEEVLEWLTRRLGEPIQLGLANSTDFRSRVMWPPGLKGKQLFEFTEPEPLALWQRILRLCRLWPWANVQHVHAEVLREARARTE
jgi:hypothetical protein